jgi:hypothetical protein
MEQIFGCSQVKWRMKRTMSSEKRSGEDRWQVQVREASEETTHNQTKYPARMCFSTVLRGKAVQRESPEKFSSIPRSETVRGSRP